MYQTKHLQAFIDKVHAEAEAAAQAVYDKYQNEFNERVISQLHPKDIMHCGMGVCSIERNGKDIENEFVDIMGRLQYPYRFQAFLSTPDIKFKKIVG